MFQPESDWRGQERAGVAHFAIDRRVELSDASVDIRRFNWVAPSTGLFSPGRHYLDYSLNQQARRSRLKAESWREEQCSGDMLYLPPGQLYRGTPALQERHLLCVALGDEFLANVFDGAAELSPLAPCSDVQSVKLRRLLDALAGELRAPGFASETLIESMLIGAVVELVRHFRGEDDVAGDAPASGRQVRAITDYVMDNLSTPLGITEIARACGMSTRTVARVFKAGTGMTLGDYVARSRIALAKEFLAGNALQVKEIGWRCGFSSPSAFCAAFRHATGVTPGEFRAGPSRLQ